MGYHVWVKTTLGIVNKHFELDSFKEVYEAVKKDFASSPFEDDEWGILCITRSDEDDFEVIVNYPEPEEI